MARLFIFGIGGTGARILRSLTMLLAGGVKTNVSQVVPIIIDLDAQNGDTNRTIRLIETYQGIRQQAYSRPPEEGFFQTDLLQLGALDSQPNAQQIGKSFQLKFGNITETFYDYLKVQALSHENQTLLSALFDNSLRQDPNTELNLALDKGFKGNPNIGSIVFNDLVNTAEYKFFESTFAQGDKIFIISSIFGGTGSSGFPQLVRNLRASNNANIKNADIGAIVVKPYFKVKNGEGRSAINSDNFISKTKAALAYYAAELNHKLNALYYVYDEPKNPYENVEGGTDQKNNAHLVEYVSAMSAVHFADRAPAGNTEHYEFGLQSDEEVINFSHFFEGTQKRFAIPLVHFTYFAKLIKDYIPRHLKNNSFAENLALPSRLQSNTDAFYNPLQAFLAEYQTWLGEMGSNRRAFQPFQLDNDFNTLLGGKVIETGLFKGKGLEGTYFDGQLIKAETALRSELPRTEERFMRCCYQVCRSAFADEVQELPKKTAMQQSFVLRLHRGGNMQLQDWAPSAAVTTEQLTAITDTLVRGNAAKAATSIPSPFARIHLFETAFQVVADRQDGEELYHALVSDCLDVFQLLFELGENNPDIQFLPWDKVGEIAALQKGGLPAHQLLGKTLEMFAQDNRFRPLDKLYFIFFRGELLGGTSPLTMFFTSPNWRRMVQDKNWQLKSSTRDVFFDNELAPLHARSATFKEFMYKFRQAYSSEFVALFPALEKYIRQSLERYDPDLKSALQTYTLAAFEQEYTKTEVKLNTNSYMYVGALPLYRRKSDMAATTRSDFELVPRHPYFRQYKDEQNIPITVPTPLVLVKGNFKGWQYIEAEWHENTMVPDDFALPLHLRFLPDSGFKKYPYVTTGDFFHDKLIELPYEINNDYFFINFNGSFRYLLPLRKTYFSYFNLEDLRKQLTVRLGTDGVEVSLDLPVKKGTIKLQKVYQFGKDLVRANFGVALFPFYRMEDRPELNDYSVMLADYHKEAEISLQFFRAEQIAEGQPVPVERKVRNAKKPLKGGTTYYRIRHQAFDCIEVAAGSCRGLIIPDFAARGRLLRNGTKQYHFAIDFGTSNTHIAYNHQQSRLPKDFEIGEADRQVVLLSKGGKGGYGELIEMRGAKEREFVPSLIGEGQAVTYPVRTATFESKTFQTENLQLFGNINLAYSLEAEESLVDDGLFTTNIKWSLENNRTDITGENRVKSFFLQTIWLIKNKILLNEGDIDSTQITWLAPLSMSVTVRDIFKRLWEESVKELFGDSAKLVVKRETESLVPYFSLLEEFRLPNVAHTVNVDIGGGTTDVLFFVRDFAGDKYYSTSFRFAGNDLWGDGIIRGQRKDNGFLSLVHPLVVTKGASAFGLADEAILRYYNALYGNESLTSADVMSLLFKYDQAFGTSNRIANAPYLKLILVVHYAAILYHLAQSAEMLGIDVPTYFTFTGKGSEYIKIISRDEEFINELTRLLLEKFTGKEAPANLAVKISQNPKASTARGALLNDGLIKERDLKNFVHSGVAKADKNAFHELQEVPQLQAGVLANFDQFVDIVFGDRDLRRLLQRIDVRPVANQVDLAKFLKDQARTSFAQVAHNLIRANPTNQVNLTDEIPETLFFWTLKDTLYRFSQEVVKRGL
jgi:Tubulin like